MVFRTRNKELHTTIKRTNTTITRTSPSFEWSLSDNKYYLVAGDAKVAVNLYYYKGGALTSIDSKEGMLDGVTVALDRDAKDVGDDYEVTISGIAPGFEDESQFIKEGNVSTTTTFTINKYSYKLSGLAFSKAYLDSDPDLETTVTLNGEEVKVTFTREAGETVGAYDVSVALNSRRNQLLGRIYVYCTICPVHAVRQIEVEMTVQ